MNVLQAVTTILEYSPETRTNNKLLIWYVWQAELDITLTLTLPQFKDATSPETILRAKRKAQALNPALRK